MPGPGAEVRRAEARTRTRAPGLDTARSFAFGHDWDPGNTSYGRLVAHNDELVDSGAGYPAHVHRDVEVVTWVMHGSLVHRDGAGGCAVVARGQVQRLSAGRGITHSETNDAHVLDPAVRPGPVRFVQSWVLPAEPGGAAEHEVARPPSALLAGRLVAVASGLPEHGGADVVRLRTGDAALHVARLVPGQAVPLPDAAYVHVYAATGVVELEKVGRLDAGDAARLTASGGPRLSCVATAEVLVWEMRSALGS